MSQDDSSISTPASAGDGSPKPDSEMILNPSPDDQGDLPRRDLDTPPARRTARRIRRRIRSPPPLSPGPSDEEWSRYTLTSTGDWTPHTPPYIRKIHDMQKENSASDSPVDALSENQDDVGLSGVKLPDPSLMRTPERKGPPLWKVNSCKLLSAPKSQASHRTGLSQGLRMLLNKCRHKLNFDSNSNSESAVEMMKQAPSEQQDDDAMEKASRDSH